MHHIEVVSQLEPEHLEQLPALLDAASRADGHEPIGEHKFLRLRRGDDLSTAVLAFEDGTLEGYGHVVTYGDGEDRRASCEFVVHPGARRKGIGRMLLSQAMKHADSLDARRLEIWAYNDSVASGRMASQFGFKPVRRLLHLHRHISATPTIVAPDGVSIRAFRPGSDEGEWLDLNRRVFAEHAEQGAWSLDDLRGRMAQPWFDPQDLLILDVDGVAGGFCWLKVEQRGDTGRVGEIYVVGAVPEQRGRGLGRYLLAEGLARLDRREVDIAAIYVDEANVAARALYASSGFHHHHIDVCYALELRGAVASLTVAAA